MMGRSRTSLPEPPVARSKVCRALEHPAVVDGHLLGGLAGGRAHGLDSCHDVHAVHNLPEDHVPTIEPLGLHGTDEELRAVGVGAGVGHAKESWAHVLELEVLVAELRAIDAFSTGTVTAREIATLDHEVGDDAVELASLVMQRDSRRCRALASFAEMNEVCHRLRHDTSEESDGDALRFSVSDLDVEEDFVGDLGLLLRSTQLGGRAQQQQSQAHVSGGHPQEQQIAL
mmetsp:Transcript_98178/g.253894  ORF Transcript_98178/g.253894 Transcript_98178/m.253894 type:complete len:229 (+) Transcript_98178:190-876(+)